MIKQFPISYTNGNVHVTIHEDGTKIREWPDDESPRASIPESCDVKITNYCDLGDVYDKDGNLIRRSKTCAFCHEASNNIGKHGNLDLAYEVLSQMNGGSEIAVGGGAPLTHPDVEDFFQKMANKNIIVNITNNMLHMKRDAERIADFQKRGLIHGLGISFRGKEYMKLLPETIDYSNVVFHCILGITTLEDITAIREWCYKRGYTPKILLLGYKQFRNGITFYSPEVRKGLDQWNLTDLDVVLRMPKMVVSFDNLAIAQMNLREKVGEEIWADCYMGDDGTSTFYVDAIEEVAAMSSTSNERFSLRDSDSLEELFGKVRKD